MTAILSHVSTQANRDSRSRSVSRMIALMSGSEQDPTVPARPKYTRFPDLCLQSGTEVGEFTLAKEIGRGRQGMAIRMLRKNTLPEQVRK